MEKMWLRGEISFISKVGRFFLPMSWLRKKIQVILETEDSSYLISPWLCYLKFYPKYYELKITLLT